jgi:5-methylcytosine-specific restriction endonuclease McrA
MYDVKLTKRCSGCQLDRPREDFYARKRSLDGLQSWCKDCNRKRSAAWAIANPQVGRTWRTNNIGRENAARRLWHAANPKRAAAYYAKYSRAHPDKCRQKCAKRRALKRACSIGDTKEVQAFYRLVREADVAKCYWCGQSVAKRKRHVDHIVPLSRGGAHAVANLCCSCSKCNLRKHNKLPSEFTGQADLFESLNL